jgi:hypothetical protein
MSAHPSARLGAPGSRRTLVAVVRHAGREALQFRLLLLWLLGMAVPTILFALPLTWFLGSELNHSPAAASLASSVGLGALIDLLDAPDLSFSLVYAVLGPPLIVMLVISPWLNALTFGAAQIPRGSRFRALISAANAGYWPMVRMGLLGLVPLMVALMLAKVAGAAVDRYDAHAVLESSSDNWAMLARLFALLLLALAQCTVEVGRAVLVAHPRRRSVVSAWWTGLAFLRRHPLDLFGSWLLITLPLLLLVAILMVLRTNLDQGSAIGLLLALLLAEGSVLVLAWMRCTRLFSMVDLVARFTAHR